MSAWKLIEPQKGVEDGRFACCGHVSSGVDDCFEPRPLSELSDDCENILELVSCWTLHCCWCESAVSEVYNDIKLHCFTFNWHVVIGHESGVCFVSQETSPSPYKGDH